MRRATAVCIGNGIAEVISIHALRGESDPWLLPLRSSTHNFNPRPPRGGRPKCTLVVVGGHRFQSTPSARRATAVKRSTSTAVFISIHALREEGDNRPAGVGPVRPYFNPRPPRGGRRRILQHGASLEDISIHALREEGDFAMMSLKPGLGISIHALREEGDGPKPFHRGWQQYFNPRPPRGGRPAEPILMTRFYAFQSTPSARRATRSSRQMPN